MERIAEGIERAASGSQPGYSRHRRRHLVLGFLICLISASYLYLSIAQGPQAILGGYPERYALLVRSFLKGSTTLPLVPRAELLALRNPYDPELNVQYRLQDASLYKGRYYLYFGVTPAVTLFLPYRILTGRDLIDRVAVPIYSILGYLSSCALFFLLARHNRWVLPLWLECSIVVALGSTSLVYLILRRPGFYEVPIAAGYFFIVSGFLVLAWVIFRQRKAAGWLFLSGLLFGASVGCRPHLALTCGIVLLAVAIRWRRSPKPVIAMTAALVLCAIALGYYNYARFDNPLEFGRTYQLTTFVSDPSATYHGLEVNLDSTFRTAKEFLFLSPQINSRIPFIRAVAINPLPSHPGPALWYEDMVGAVPTSPFLLLGFAFPIFVRSRTFKKGSLDNTSIWLLSVIYVSAIAIFVVLCFVGWVLVRYLLDFAPLLNFEGIVLAVMLWQTSSTARVKRFYTFAIGAVTVYGAVVNLALATPSWRSTLEFLGK